MGHRAIVLYETNPNGLYNAHYSHWGASDLRLASEINEGQPFGGDKSEPAFAGALIKMFADEAGDDVEISGELAEATDTREVDPTPIKRNVTIEEAFADIVDYLHHEAVFVVRRDEDGDFDVTAYRTHWLGFSAEPHENTEEVTGLLTTVRWHDGRPVSDSRDRGKIAGTKNTLGALAAEDGAITREDINDVWPDGSQHYTDIDLSDVLTAAQQKADSLDGCDGLFTYDAAREILRRMILAEYDEDLSKYVHSASAAVTEEDWERYPLAFLCPRGMTRVLGEMYPTGYSEMAPHEVSDGMTWPEPVN